MPRQTICTDTRRKANRERAQTARDRLSDGYIRSLITRGSALTAADVPQPLVEAKRAHLLLKRGLKALAEGDTETQDQLNSVADQMKGAS